MQDNKYLYNYARQSKNTDVSLHNSYHRERSRLLVFSSHTIRLPQYGPNKQTTQSYHYLYSIREVKTLDLTNVKSTDDRLSKNSHKSRYWLINTSQIKNTLKWINQQLPSQASYYNNKRFTSSESNQQASYTEDNC